MKMDFKILYFPDFKLFLSFVVILPASTSYCSYIFNILKYIIIITTFYTKKLNSNNKTECLFSKSIFQFEVKQKNLTFGPLGIR